MLPPVPKSPSPAIPNPVPEPVPESRARNNSFPVDWFYNEDSAPISEDRIQDLKRPKPLPKPKANEKPFQLSPVVEVYHNILVEQKKDPN